MTKQYQSEDIKELAAALAKAQGEMQHAKKDAENPAFKREGSVSKYADLPAVIDAARQYLSKNGLSVTHLMDTDEAGRMLLITTLMHSSGQWQRSWYPVTPVKNDPQGLGSAITYARRYSYAAITGVAAAGEDDDGNAASDVGSGDKSAKAKSVFASPELRAAFKATILSALANAATIKDLKDRLDLDRARVEAMKSSGDVDDFSIREEIVAAYNARLVVLKEQEQKKPATVDSAVKGVLGDDYIPHS